MILVRVNDLDVLLQCVRLCEVAVAVLAFIALKTVMRIIIKISNKKSFLTNVFENCLKLK